MSATTGHPTSPTTWHPLRGGTAIQVRQVRIVVDPERLKAVREQRGLSQTEAARRLGVGKTTWNGWEIDRPMSSEMAVRTADVLSCTVEDFCQVTPLDQQPPMLVRQVGVGG